MKIFLTTLRLIKHSSTYMLATLFGRLRPLLSSVVFPNGCSINHHCWLILGCIFFSLQYAHAQNNDTIKVAAYNLLHYPDVSSGAASALDTTNRHPHYRNIVSAMDPDILVVEEVQSPLGFTWFLNGVMNANQMAYGGATFVNGPDMDAGLFYKTSKFQFIATKTIATNLRNIYEYTLRHISTGDTLRVYAVHLKASAGSLEEQQRLSEVDSLRKVTNALPSGSNFIVLGDFNLYGAQEPAYLKLKQVQAGAEGHFFDLINLPGVWNDPTYAAHHTQSTRTRSFGGGSTGGVDDRFDLILYSKAITDAGGMEVVPNSLVPFGNDGNHYNDSINKFPNTAVNVSVANALHQASDHLPITMKFLYRSILPSNNDVGAYSLVTNGNYCPTSTGQLKVLVRNYGTSILNFSTTNVTVHASVINPLNNTQSFTVLLAAGQLNAGQDTLVTVSSNYGMTVAGNYLVSAYTTMSNDQNSSNDAMSPGSFTVLNSMVSSITPAGPIQLCSGNSTTLTSNAGLSYLWSTGATTSAVIVNQAGTYQVTVTYTAGCTSTSNSVIVNLASSATSTVLFRESIGSVSATTTIAAHEVANGFQNMSYTMSGTADVRTTQPSGGYPGATGGANIFLTNTVGRYFTIAGINTSGLSSMSIDFGIYKSTTASTGSELKVQVSDDGVNFSDLSFAGISGGSTWYLRTATGTIPQTNNLRLRFYQTSTNVQFRVDDIVFKFIPSSYIVAADTLVCAGDSVLLTASVGNSYLWSTGSTSQSIYIYNSGSYSVSVDCILSNTKIIQVCGNTHQLNLKCFIEGLAIGGNVMTPRLFNAGISTNPLSCDSVLIEWRSSLSPFTLMGSSKQVMNVYGDIVVPVPNALWNQSYYIVVRQMSGIETWSKFPVFMGGNLVNFSFSGP